MLTPYDLTFMDPVPWRSLCEEYMDLDDVRSFFTYNIFFKLMYLIVVVKRI